MERWSASKSCRPRWALGLTEGGCGCTRCTAAMRYVCAGDIGRSFALPTAASQCPSEPSPCPCSPRAPCCCASQLRAAAAAASSTSSPSRRAAASWRRLIGECSAPLLPLHQHLRTCMPHLMHPLAVGAACPASGQVWCAQALAMLLPPASLLPLLPASLCRLFERDGVQVVCDDISLEFLKGSTGEDTFIGHWMHHWLLSWLGCKG